jgi:hypothetical protein
MTDPYVWLDAHAERELGKREAERAHVAGMQFVLDKVTDRQDGEFYDLLQGEIRRMAERIAFGLSKEWMGSWAEYRQYSAFAKAYIEYASFHPTTRYVMGGAKLEITAEQDRGPTPQMYVSLHRMKPIEYSVNMMPLPQAPAYGEE